MGLGGMVVSRGSSYLTNSRNPDPNRFHVEKCERAGRYYVSRIYYPNCTNFEGKKILVTSFDPYKRNVLDPHFTIKSGLIARFEPTDAGWRHAMSFAKNSY